MSRRTARSIRPLGTFSRAQLYWATAVAAGIGLATLGVGTAPQLADRSSEARNRARLVLNAASTWKEERGVPGCPSLTQLRRDRELGEGWQEADPWGERFRIICTEQDIRVLSAGRDGVFQTDDDIEEQLGGHDSNRS